MKEAQENMRRFLKLCNVPSGLHEALLAYIYHGHLPGDFLQAVLRNDLMDVISRADQSSLNSMNRIVMFLNSYAPFGCYGSKQAVKDWHTNKGMEAFRVGGANG